MQVKAGETIKVMNKLHDNLHEDFKLFMQLHNLILHEVWTLALSPLASLQAPSCQTACHWLA